MKKIAPLILAALLIITLFSGCKASPSPAPSGSGSPSPSASKSPSSPSSSAAASPSEPSTSAGSAKTGLAVLSSLTKSKDAGEQPGVAQFDATVVAVTVNKDGVIQKCAIDAVQAKVNFDDKGQLTTPVGTDFKSKNELGEAYGMKKASGIGKEWYEQAAAFSKHVEGMTVEEVKGIKVDEQNYPTQADLKASVTISVGSFLEGIEKAVQQAKEGGASESDKLNLGIVATLTKGESAGEAQPGLAQVGATFAVVTKDAGGVVTSCILDGLQASVNFNATGKITTDLSVNPKTKNELGEAYGMKKASGIGKEWNEQAEAFAQYVTGKTAAEIEGIAVNEEGYAVSSDITASVTIAIDGFLAALKKVIAMV